MPEKKVAGKSLVNLAADLRKIRNRKPSAQQIEELNSLLEKPRKKNNVTPKKIARPRDVET